MAVRDFTPSTLGLHLSYGPGRCQGNLPGWGRDLSLTTGRPCSESVRWHREVAHEGRELVLPPQATGAPSLGRERTVEELWGVFFSDPSQWWDNRWEKGNAKYPDFTHKTTREALWVESKLTPKWVGAELTSLAPDSVQLNIFSWNKRLAKHVKARQYQTALDLFHRIQRDGIDPDKFTFIPVLSACAGLRALEVGRRIHAQIVQRGHDCDEFVGSSLVTMYAKCGSIEDSRKVFDKMPKRDVVTWTSLITGYVKCGQGKQALELAGQMLREGLEPNRFTFVALLNACASIPALEEGKKVHEQINQSCFEYDVFVGSSLVDMYAKCGRVEEAREVFDKMPSRNVVTWNVMILACAKFEQGEKALELYRQMQKEEIEPHTATFVAVLNACASLGALEEGRRVHQQIIQSGCKSNMFVTNSLVDMYAKCGSIEDAWTVFAAMPTRNIFAYSIIVQGYVKYGQGEKALAIVRQMQSEGVEPDPVFLVAVLNACASVRALEEGRRIHAEIIQKGYESDVFIGSSLVHMYAKCQSIDDAVRVFDDMPERDVVAWSAMILGYVNCGQPKEALELSRQMQDDGILPNRFTILAVLKACASLGCLEEGRRAHERIIGTVWESDLFVGSSLVDMYAKCGSIEDSLTVFSKMPTKDAIAWSTIILVCAKCGRGEKALELSQQMQEEGIQPEPVVYVGLLNACAGLAALEEGRCVHEQIIRSGIEDDLAVGNSLVDMYSKCGSIDEAWKVFVQMPTHDVIGWSSLILGYVKNGKGEKALELSQQMYREGVKPNSFTFVALLNACGNLGALEDGRRVHAHAVESECDSDVFVATSLIDMYAKCESIDESRRVFHSMPNDRVEIWNAMIVGYVRCRLWWEALEQWHQMRGQGLDPNPVTYVALLNACGSLGALEEGTRVHGEIIRSGCESDVYVGCSLIDMYARCGSVEDASSVFNKMPRRDAICYNAMVRGYVHSGQEQKAVELYQEMRHDWTESEPAKVFNERFNIASLAEDSRQIHPNLQS